MLFYDIVLFLFVCRLNATDCKVVCMLNSEGLIEYKITIVIVYDFNYNGLSSLNKEYISNILSVNYRLTKKKAKYIKYVFSDFFIKVITTRLSD